MENNVYYYCDHFNDTSQEAPPLQAAGVRYVMWYFMKKMLFINIILSIIDAGATAVGIKIGYIREANPIIGGFILRAPTTVSFLVCLSSVFLLLLIYAYRHRMRWIKYGLLLILAVKILVVCLHISSIFLALRSILYV